MYIKRHITNWQNEKFTLYKCFFPPLVTWWTRFKSIWCPGNLSWETQLFKMFWKILFVARRLVFFTDFIFAVPQCPIEFPAPHFPTEHRPHLAFAGGRSGSVSLADSWDSSACTSLASGSGYLSPRLTAIQGSPPLQRLILRNTCSLVELVSNVAM